MELTSVCETNKLSVTLNPFIMLKQTRNIGTKWVEILTSLFHDGGTYHLVCKSMDWFLYDRDVRHERFKHLNEQVCKHPLLN